MGGHPDYRIYDTQDRAEVEKRWKADQKQAAHDNGHDAYAGTIATMRGGIAAWYDKSLATEDEAVEFLLSHHNKWDPAVAVSFFLTSKEKDAAREKRTAAAMEKANKARADYFALHEKICQRFAARKCARVGCMGCGSLLSHAFLCRPNAISAVCPLCKRSLISKTDQARLDKAQAKREAADKAYQESKKPRPGEKLGWLVGGWAAS